MIVDDEATTLKMTKQGLERFDFNVAIFSKPHEALEYFRTNKDQIDLVISDKSMPKMNGEELVKNIRLISQSIPIFVLSGFVSKEDDTELISIGATKVLLKPLSIKDIVVELRDTLKIP